MAVRLAASIFVGFVLESVLYGAFIIIFLSAAITQWERWKVEKLRAGNKLVMGFSILLLAFISTVSVSCLPPNPVFKLEQHWILNFCRCYDVFLRGSDLSTMDGAFANQRNGTNLARFIVYEVQAWMGDCLLVTRYSHILQPNAHPLFSKIYRLYHVCGRKWSIVAVPCIMCSALVGEYLIFLSKPYCCLCPTPQVCGFCLLMTTAKLNFLDPQSMKPFHAWAVACFALTFG